MKKYIVLLIGLVLFSASVFADDGPITIRVGVYENRPKIYTDEDGAVSGFWPDLVRYIAAEEGWEIEWVPGTWSQGLERLEENQIDIMPDTGWTEERSQKYAFSKETVLISWSRLYAPTGSDIQSILDLEGRTIAALEDSFNLNGPEGIKDITAGFGVDCTFLEMENYTRIFEALENKEIDAGVTNKDFGNQHEDDFAVERTPIIFQPARMQFAFTKDASLTPYLIERIDIHMKELKEDQDSIYYQALEKHIGGEVTETFIKIIPDWVKSSLLVGSGVILFLLAVGIVSRVQVRQRTADLQESEEHFRRAIMDAPFPIMIHAEDGEVVQINTMWTELTGYTDEEIPTIADWTERAYGEKKSLVRADIDRLYDLDTRVDEGEYTITTSSGEKRTWHFSSAPLGALPDGRRLVLSIAADITERRQRERELQEAERRFRTLLDNVRLVAVGLDEEGSVAYANPYLLELTGYKPDDVLGQSWFQTFIPERERPAVGAVFSEILEAGIHPHYENSIVTKGGEERLIAWNNTLLLDPNGKPVGTMSIGEHITERKRAEEELRKHREHLEELVVQRTAELNERVAEVEQLNLAMANLLEDLRATNRDLEETSHRLQRTNAELEAFTYSVSHDLKAPLRGIDGYSRLLLEDHAEQMDEEGRTFLHTIRRAADQMSQLIEDMLAYSRLERRSLTAGRVNPQALVEVLVAERAEEIAARSVQMTVNVPCQAVTTDAEGLAQALRNLFENALKFTREAPQPKIEIGGRETEESCIIWVRDNGIGFVMQYHDRIFEIFQRLHRDEDYPGTGVGLAIVRKAAERMGGRVWAESTPSEGATFYLEIPR